MSVWEKLQSHNLLESEIPFHIKRWCFCYLCWCVCVCLSVLKPSFHIIFRINLANGMKIANSPYISEVIAHIPPYEWNTLNQPVDKYEVDYIEICFFLIQWFCAENNGQRKRKKHRTPSYIFGRFVSIRHFMLILPKVGRLFFFSAFAKAGDPLLVQLCQMR